MNATIAHAPVPIAVFRGPQHECVVASGSWQQLFEPDIPPVLLERLNETYRSQQRSEAELRLRLSAHGPTARTYRIVIQPLPGDELMATCIDQTDVRLAQADAERSRRLKEQLLAAVSHDLRAPMSTILLWERVLRDRIDEVETRQRALDAIRESATTQSNLIAELVDAASVVNGTIELSRDSVALESVLATALEPQVAPARAKGVSFVSDYQPPLGHVHADPARLRQAFAKVIETAVRISPHGTTILISARRRRTSIVVTIGDSELDAHSRTLEPIAALELGLVVASELVALHAGTFEAMRPHAGNVPTYSISLPIVARRSGRT
jgi:K+-sensing histidine kinase KdpD